MDWKYLPSSTRASSSACQNKIMQHNSPNTASSTTVKNSLGPSERETLKKLRLQYCRRSHPPGTSKEASGEPVNRGKGTTAQHTAPHSTSSPLKTASTWSNHYTRERNIQRNKNKNTHSWTSSSAGTTFCPTVFFFKWWSHHLDGFSMTPAQNDGGRRRRGGGWRFLIVVVGTPS